MSFVCFYVSYASFPAFWGGVVRSNPGAFGANFLGVEKLTKGLYSSHQFKHWPSSPQTALPLRRNLRFERLAVEIGRYVCPVSEPIET